MNDIKQQAIKLSKTPGFKASNGWFDKFIKRWNITRHTPTHIIQNICDNTFEQIKIFFNQLVQYRLKIQSEGKEIVFFNLDETTLQISFDRKTYDQKGSKEILIQGTKQLKERITILLMINGSGIYFPPLIIFKGSKNRKVENSYQSKYLLFQNDNAWVTEEIYTIYLKSVLKNLKYDKSKKNSICIFHDRCSAHLKHSVRQLLKENQIKEFIIPSGCTSLLQVLDVSENKGFKDLIHFEFDGWQKEKQASDSTQLYQPTKIKYVNWILSSLESIDPDSIKKGFKICGVNTQLDSSENDMINKKLINRDLLIQHIEDIQKGIIQDIDDHDMEILKLENTDIVDSYEIGQINQSLLQELEDEQNLEDLEVEVEQERLEEDNLINCKRQSLLISECTSEGEEIEDIPLKKLKNGNLLIKILIS
ncbi:hypothetical protein ABPG72_012116 [Tetrahymena utriculariae]